MSKHSCSSIKIGRRELTLKAAAKGGARGGAVVAAGGLRLRAVEAAGKRFAGARPEPGAVLGIDEMGTWERELAHQPKALILSRDHIATPFHRSGVSSTRSSVAMTDGSEHKLLWLPNAHAENLLTQVFGPQFQRSRTARVVSFHPPFTQVFPQLQQLVTDRALTTVTSNDIFQTSVRRNQVSDRTSHISRGASQKDEASPLPRLQIHVDVLLSLFQRNETGLPAVGCASPASSSVGPVSGLGT